MSTFTDHPSTGRRRRRAKKSSALPIVLALVTVVALPLLGFVAYKVLNKPPEVHTVVEVVKGEPERPPVDPAKAAAQEKARKAREQTNLARSQPQQPRTPVRPQSSDFGANGRVLSVSGAMSRIGDTLNEALGLGKKVLIVWIFDRSPGATPLRQETISNLDKLYGKLKASDKEASGEDSQIVSAVISYASDVNFALEKPSGDLQEVTGAATGIQVADADMSNTFTAVQNALDKYVDFRKKGRYVRFVVVSDAAAYDDPELDPLVPNLEKYQIPVDCIGQEAPFADIPVMHHKFGETSDAEKPVRHRTDSRYPEWIHLDFPNGPDQSITSIETELGPYSMERLCRSSGGVYFALPKGMSGWGSSGSTLPRTYTPDYISEAANQEQLQKNKAKKALVEAARLPQADSLRGGTSSISNSDDVQRVRALDSAQKPAAKIMPGINTLYDTLKPGESDEPKLEPRWRAAFDLAYGRAMAAKARADSYIDRLAVLKTNSKFKNPNSTVWLLEKTDDATGNSPVDKMASKAREYLNRVKEQNPNTPWAVAADRELGEPMGFKWVER